MLDIELSHLLSNKSGGDWRSMFLLNGSASCWRPESWDWKLQGAMDEFCILTEWCNILTTRSMILDGSASHSFDPENCDVNDAVHCKASRVSWCCIQFDWENVFIFSMVRLPSHLQHREGVMRWPRCWLRMELSWVLQTRYVCGKDCLPDACPVF